MNDCIDYAASIGRIPSISELCRAAHVSERTLRSAFIDEFAVPPARYFRMWGLGEAHRRLTHGATEAATVTEVAADMNISLPAAENILTSMDDGFRVRSEISKEGVLYYEFPELVHRRELKPGLEPVD